MTIITIPYHQKSLAKGDYVLVPKSEYEELIERARVIPVIPMTTRDHRGSARADREIKAGKYRPWKQVKHELDRLHNIGR